MHSNTLYDVRSSMKELAGYDKEDRWVFECPSVCVVIGEVNRQFPWKGGEASPPSSRGPRRSPFKA